MAGCYASGERPVAAVGTAWLFTFMGVDIFRWSDWFASEFYYLSVSWHCAFHLFSIYNSISYFAIIFCTVHKHARVFPVNFDSALLTEVLAQLKPKLASNLIYSTVNILIFLRKQPCNWNVYEHLKRKFGR